MRRLRPTRTLVLLVSSLLVCGAAYAAVALSAGHARPAAGGALPAASGRVNASSRAAASASAGPHAVRLISRGVSPRLSSIVVPTRTPGPVRPAPSQENEPSAAVPAGPSRPDGALQRGSIGNASPSLLSSFEGLSNDDNATVNNNLVNIPPDTTGDVGPSNYVEATNIAIGVYSKAGAKLAGPVSLKSLWANLAQGLCHLHNDGDPIVMFDPLSNRWLISQFAFLANNSQECIAVSQTSNPAGLYWLYDFQISTTKFADYPKIGVWPDGYYVTFNDYVGTSNSGVSVLALRRADVQAGFANPAGVLWSFAQSAGLFGLLPADVDGGSPPATQQEVFVQLNRTAHTLQLYQAKPNYATPAASTFVGLGSLTPAAFDPNMCGYLRNCIAQPGTTNKVDALSDRLMQRLAYRNLGTSQNLVVVHNVDATGADRAGVRWYNLRKTTGSWSIAQQGTFSPDSTNRWDGSGAMDKKGDIAVGFSAGSSSVFPSIRYAARVPSDPAGTLQSEVTMQAGGGSQLTGTFSGTGPNRWGDYSTMSVDPSNNCTFWYLGQYYSASSSYKWKTRIGSFKFPTCT